MKVLLMLLAVGVAGFALVRPATLLRASQPAPAVPNSDDPPKKDKASRRGTPTGEVQGGTGGEVFRDRAYGRLAKLTIHAGELVDGIRCTWDDEGVPEDGTNHGGSGGERTVVTLEPGETLVQVSGTMTEGEIVVIGSLSFKTNKRTLGPFGGTAEGKKFTIDVPKGQEICGFQGRSGDYLDAIGIVCRPVP